MNFEFGAYYRQEFHCVYGEEILADTMEEALEIMQELRTPYEYEQGNFATDAPGGNDWLHHVEWKPCVFIDGEVHVPLR